MLENDFEKQMQDALHSFKVKASEENWNKIAARLPQPRKYRRLGWWLAIAAAAALLGFFFFPNLQQDAEENLSVVSHSSNGNNTSRTPSSNGTASPKANGQASLNKSDNVEASITKSDNAQASLTKGATSNNKYDNTASLTKDDLAISKKGSSLNAPVAINNTGRQYQPSIFKSSVNSPSFAASQPVSSNNNDASSSSTSNTSPSASPVNKINVFAGTTLPQKSLPSVSSMNIEAQQWKKAQELSKKWNQALKWTAYFSAGSSIPVQSLKEFNNTPKFETFASADLAGRAPNISVGSNQGFLSPVGLPTVEPLQPANARLSMSVGIQAAKKIHKNFDLAISLQYSLFQTEYRTGQAIKLDTFNFLIAQPNNPTDLFANGNTLKFKNQFHYLEMPIEIIWKMNPYKVSGSSLALGVVPGMMMGVNALHYNNSTGAYYKNKEEFSTAQLGLQLSYSKQFSFGKGQLLSVGPLLRASMTNLRNNDAHRPENLGFMGIKVGYRF
jgi:hypothetical protein